MKKFLLITHIVGLLANRAGVIGGLINKNPEVATWAFAATVWCLSSGLTAYALCDKFKETDSKKRT